MDWQSTTKAQRAKPSIVSGFRACEALCACRNRVIRHLQATLPQQVQDDARLVSFFCSNIRRSIASATVRGTFTDSVVSSRQPPPFDALAVPFFDADDDGFGADDSRSPPARRRARRTDWSGGWTGPELLFGHGVVPSWLAAAMTTGAVARVMSRWRMDEQGAGFVPRIDLDSAFGQDITIDDRLTTADDDRMRLEAEGIEFLVCQADHLVLAEAIFRRGIDDEGLEMLEQAKDAPPTRASRAGPRSRGPSA